MVFSFFYRFFKLSTFIFIFIYVYLETYRAWEVGGKNCGKISGWTKKNCIAKMFQCNRAFQFEVREIQRVYFLLNRKIFSPDMGKHSQSEHFEIQWLHLASVNLKQTFVFWWFRKYFPKHFIFFWGSVCSLRIYGFQRFTNHSGNYGVFDLCKIFNNFLWNFEMFLWNFPKELC